MKTSTLVLLSGLCSTALAVCKTSVTTGAAAYQQCGGKGFSGPTTCTSGLKCYCQSEYYSQCLATDPKWAGTGCSSSKSSPAPAIKSSPTKAEPQQPKKAAPAPVHTTSTKPAASAPTTPASSSPITTTPGTCAAYTGSKTGYASTTHYYDGTAGACGCSTGGSMSSWQASAGEKIYTAAGSQNLFAGSGSTSSWCGSGCGKCYKLTNVGAVAADRMGDCTGAKQSITVMVTNLCPAQGNAEWCAQPKNKYEFESHFDIMSKDGPEGWNNPVVKYEEITCPGSLVSDFATCQCTSGKTSRVRRGLVGA